MNRTAQSLLKVATATTLSMGLLAVPYRWRESQHPTFSLAAQNAPLADVMTIGSAINEKGEFTGTAFDEKGETVRAFVVSGRDGKLLPLPSGAEMSVGSDINDKTEVAGTAFAEGGEGEIKGVVWRGGTPSVLEKDGKGTMAVGINSTGVTVGNAFDDKGVEAVAWKSSGESIGLGNFVARGMSNRAAVGYTYGETVEPVLFESGKLTKLPLPAGTRVGIAFGVSDKNSVVGAISDKESNPIPAAWNGNKLTLLKTLGGGHGLAAAVSERGDIVGIADTKNGETHAVIWRGNKIIDLNEAADIKDWTLVTAVDINNKGEIIGTAVNQKARKASAYVLRVR